MVENIFIVVAIKYSKSLSVVVCELSYRNMFDLPKVIIDRAKM